MFLRLFLPKFRRYEFFTHFILLQRFRLFEHQVKKLLFLETLHPFIPFSAGDLSIHFYTIKIAVGNSIREFTNLKSLIYVLGFTKR